MLISLLIEESGVKIGVDLSSKTAITQLSKSEYSRSLLWVRWMSNKVFSKNFVVGAT